MSQTGYFAFVVEGAGAFPKRLLRRGECWAATERDLLKLERVGQRSVRLHSRERPDPKRWREFGWPIVAGDGMVPK